MTWHCCRNLVTVCSKRLNGWKSLQNLQDLELRKTRPWLWRLMQTMHSQSQYEVAVLKKCQSTARGTEEDMNARLGKARGVFKAMEKVWRSKGLPRRTNVRLFNSNVKTILMYASETWKLSEKLINRAQLFINRCLRKILNISWPERISNDELWKRTEQEPTSTRLKRRKWKWLGRTLQRDKTCIPKQSPCRKPDGHRKRGRPKNTWRRNLDKEIQDNGMNWRQVEAAAQDRQGWRRLVCDPAPVGVKRFK